jgi:peptide/nickel transport system permease protein
MSSSGMSRNRKTDLHRTLFPVAGYVLRRLGAALAVLLGISLLVFIITYLQPGDPYASMIDPAIAPEDREQILRNLGYYDPLWLKYVSWLKRVLVGDWGYSIQFGMPVSTVILERVGNTLVLGGAALGLAVLAAVPLGLYAGVHRGELGEKAITGLSFVLMSIPAFFMALVLIATLSARLHLFPSSGIVTAGSTAGGWALVWDVIHHLVLPAVVLSFVSFATYCRYVQSSVSELLDKDFVRALFARRIPRTKVFGVHLMKNAAKPLLTTLSIGVPQLLSGALITESVFSWPGIGQLSYQAATTRDYSLLLGITLFLAVITLLANLIADLLYLVVDPRIRISQ